MRRTQDPIIQTYETYLEAFSAEAMQAVYPGNVEAAGLIGKAPKSFDITQSKFAAKK